MKNYLLIISSIVLAGLIYFSLKLLPNSNIFPDMTVAFYSGAIFDDEGRDAYILNVKSSKDSKYSFSITSLKDSGYSTVKEVVYNEYEPLVVILQNGDTFKFSGKELEGQSYGGIVTTSDDQKLNWELNRLDKEIVAKKELSLVDRINAKKNLLRSQSQKESLDEDYRKVISEIEQIEDIINNPEKFKDVVKFKIDNFIKEQNVYKTLIEEEKNKLSKQLKILKRTQAVTTIGKLVKANREAFKAEGVLYEKLLQYPTFEKVGYELKIDEFLNKNSSMEDRRLRSALAKERDLIYLLKYKLRQKEAQ